MFNNFEIARVMRRAPLKTFFFPRFFFVSETACGTSICFCVAHKLFALSRNELPTTDTLENAIASPAKTGFKSQPNIG